jgi:hypothetical protein
VLREHQVYTQSVSYKLNKTLTVEGFDVACGRDPKVVGVIEACMFVNDIARVRLVLGGFAVVTVYPRFSHLEGVAKHCSPAFVIET